MLKGLYLLDPQSFDLIYGPDEREQIRSLIEVPASLQTQASVAQNPAVLNDVEVILSGWGCPVLSEELLSAAPQLKLVLYGAGSLRGVVTEAFWSRHIPIVSAWGVNAVPVCEFALAQILLSLKRYWAHVALYHQKRKPERLWVPGGFGSTVGIISLGMIGQLLAERLRSFDIKVLAYDPFASQEMANRLGVELCSLADVFKRSDVVSLHTPWLKETEGMITGELFASMKPGATFINTARGAVVNEPEMIEVLNNRHDLYALLDVTHPEPPDPDSALFTLPNVVLTPHIAGAMETECRRMSQAMIAELKRFLNDEPLHWQVTRERASILA